MWGSSARDASGMLFGTPNATYFSYNISSIGLQELQILMDNILGDGKMWHSSSSDAVGGSGF